jgi:4-hydroxyphenylacetate 3-monooxygenase
MIRSGQDYVSNLSKNSPRVYYGGRLIDDVTREAAFRPAIEMISGYYDMQHDQKGSKLSAMNTQTGELSGLPFITPSDKEGLERLGNALEEIYSKSNGLVGRGPAFLNMFLMLFNAHADEYAEQGKERYAENVRNIYREAAKQDLFHTHAIIAPAYDRMRPPSKWENPDMQAGVVKETAEGIIVKGAAMLATAGPYAERIMYMPNVRRDPNDRYLVYFSVPTNTDGISFVSRREFGPRGGTGRFEYPISSTYAEGDAMVVYDSALIPWDRVIAYGDAESITKFRWDTVQLRTWWNWHMVIQCTAKIRFLAGLAISVAEALGIDGFVNVQEKLGEILIYLSMGESAIVSSIEKGEQLDMIYRPNRQISSATAYMNTKAIPRINEILRQLPGGASIPIPATMGDFSNPEELAMLKMYLGVKGAAAVERAKLFNIYWDAVASENGMRNEQYDRFNLGDPTRKWAALYTDEFKERKEEYKRLVKELSDSMPNPEEAGD